jgi:glycosyltransferase involved in cell wall biosynthesis
MSLTVSIIARDEGSRISRCLESVQWADEIRVIVDDRSTDNTAEVARRFTNQVHVRAFAGFSDQRQWADDQASSDWILSLDCDEVVTAELADEIRTVVARSSFDAFRVPHLDYMFGRWIRHGGWYPQYHVRLYRRGEVRWERAVHEAVSVPRKLGTLRHPILHYSHRRVIDWVAKMERYTTLEALSLYDNGTRIGLARLVFEPILYAGYKLIIQQGWRDGVHGFVLANLLGCYRMIRNFKLWDLQQAARGAREPGDWPPSIFRS